MRCCRFSSGSSPALASPEALIPAGRADRRPVLPERERDRTGGRVHDPIPDLGRAGMPHRSPSRRRPGASRPGSASVASTSPMLSNPYPISSAGNSSAGCRSRPIRSRIVLLYSARLSRRSADPPAGVVIRPERGVEPGVERFPILRTGTRLALRRHAFRSQGVGHAQQERPVRPVGNPVFEAIEDDAAFGAGAVVTAQADTARTAVRRPGNTPAWAAGGTIVDGRADRNQASIGPFDRGPSQHRGDIGITAVDRSRWQHARAKVVPRVSEVTFMARQTRDRRSRLRSKPGCGEGIPPCRRAEPAPENQGINTGRS